MAKIIGAAISGLTDYAIRLSKLGDKSFAERALKRAIHEGANVIANEIKRNLNALPTEAYRKLKPGEKFDGLPQSQKKDLIDSFGLTAIEQDRNGVWNTKAGFDGYGSHATKKYPEGLPNQLLARSVESGSSVREKRPFVRPAVTAKRTETVRTMERVLDEEIIKIME